MSSHIDGVPFLKTNPNELCVGEYSIPYEAKQMLIYETSKVIQENK